MFTSFVMFSIILELLCMLDKKVHFVVDQLKPKEKVQKVVTWLKVRANVLAACLPFCVFTLRTGNHPIVWP